MKLPLAYYDHPILRVKGKPIEAITDEIRELVDNMVETMIEHNGFGLAAPQVHLSLNLFIMSIPKEQPDGKWLPGQLQIFINPKIISVSQETNMRSEGCLSIPSLHAEVTRPNSVTIESTKLDGKRVTEEFHDLEARCVLHENDHINGVLFIDRILGKARIKIEPHLRRIKKKWMKDFPSLGS